VAKAPLPMAISEAGIGQILKNVLTNAVEALASAGTAKPRIEVVVTDRGGTVEISVRDNGPGIAPTLLDQLGEPFQTTKEHKGGMGLGLYVSTVLAQRMHGHLIVASGEDGGTRVTLTLKKTS